MDPACQADHHEADKDKDGFSLGPLACVGICSRKIAFGQEPTEEGPYSAKDRTKEHSSQAETPFVDSILLSGSSIAMILLLVS